MIPNLQALCKRSLKEGFYLKADLIRCLHMKRKEVEYFLKNYPEVVPPVQIEGRYKYRLSSFLESIDREIEKQTAI